MNSISRTMPAPHRGNFKTYLSVSQRTSEANRAKRTDGVQTIDSSTATRASFIVSTNDFGDLTAWYVNVNAEPSDSISTTFD